MRFQDRREAGEALGRLLAQGEHARPVVLGLPRGGVPVAEEVARILGAPLDVLVVRKLGVPGYPELAMGAVGEGGAMILNEGVIASAGVPRDEVARCAERERAEVVRRTVRFREGRAGVDLAGRTAIVVDDGFATGATARAACRIARERGAARIVLSVPVAPPGTAASFDDSDETICCAEPRDFVAVGRHYADFTQVDDAEVVAILRSAHGGDAPS